MVTDRLCLLLLAVSLVSCEAGDGGSGAGNSGQNDVVVAQVMKNVSLPRPEYVHWIESRESGLTAEKKIDKLLYSVQYKPVHYEALIRMGNEGVSQEKLRILEHELSGMQYYTLRVSAKDYPGEVLKYKLPDTDEYYRRIEYCSFRMQEDITLVDNNDTLPCRLFHFERVFGVAPEATFVLAFEDTRSEADKQAGRYETEKMISFNDELFGMGIINLRIPKAHLNNIPRLNAALNN